MAQQRWWRRVLAAIEGEYERRIRRASLVGAYGAGHHGHGAAEGPATDVSPLDDGEEAAIVNVPKGTPLARQPQPPPADPSLPPS
ncbi:MAG TPA: hypothetical protein PKD53_00340 [Chloroflexaceae bacterium]|nr:hypothetical protein [Chloroflexaceae bacterium]